MIAIIDYGMGNLRSVAKAVEKIGSKVVVTSDINQLKLSDGLILPGVGAFYQAMQNLNNLNLPAVIRELINNGKPLLGICLGLQLLFSESNEGGVSEGLNLIEGKVTRFSLTKIKPNTKIPHMGWNSVTYTKKGKKSMLWKNIPEGTFFYFAHSYFVTPKTRAVIIGQTEYGFTYTSVIGKNNVFGTQFHPEKSGPLGIRLLTNFCEIVENNK